MRGSERRAMPITPSELRMCHVINLERHLREAREAAEAASATGLEPADKRTAQVLRALEAEANASIEGMAQRAAAAGGAA